MCSECPFNKKRKSGEVETEVMETVIERIKGGEKWICHLTCGAGGQPNKRTMYCKGAKGNVFN